MLRRALLADRRARAGRARRCTGAPTNRGLAPPSTRCKRPQEANSSWTSASRLSGRLLDTARPEAKRTSGESRRLEERPCEREGRRSRGRGKPTTEARSPRSQRLRGLLQQPEPRARGAAERKQVVTQAPYAPTVFGEARGAERQPEPERARARAGERVRDRGSGRPTALRVAEELPRADAHPRAPDPAGGGQAGSSIVVPGHASRSPTSTERSSIGTLAE